MRLIIHRGAHEIGGNCVELQSQSRSLLLDLGMPLVNPDRTDFDENALKGKDAALLVQEGVLPSVIGLYGDGDSSVEAILLSHSHGDHCGLGRYVRPDVPFLMSRGTHATIDVASAFVPNASKLANMAVIGEMWEPLRLGPFEVKAHPVDHSAYDALAFEVAADHKRLLYSGDLRFHGRTRNKSENLIARPPRDIDAMLMEGSSFGRSEEEYPFENEEDVEKGMMAAIQSCRNLAVVFASGQNVDRLHSVYRAARRLGRNLVIDPYTAALLAAWKTDKNRLIQWHSDGISVLLLEWHMARLKVLNIELHQVLERSGQGISIPDLLSDPEQYVLLARPNQLFRKAVLDTLSSKEGLCLIWSMWGGYLKREGEPQMLLEFCRSHRLELQPIHTSGHATIRDLKRLVDAVRPKQLIPIHTFEPDAYKSLAGKVVQLRDREPLTL